MKKRVLNIYKIVALALLFATVFFAANAYVYANRLEVLKDKVIYYDYNRGGNELKQIARNI